MKTKPSKRVLVTQVAGLSGQSARTRAAITALGLGRIGKSREFNTSPALEGMFVQCSHLVKVSEITK